MVIKEEEYKHELLGCKLVMNNGEEKHFDNIEGHGFSNDTGKLTYMFRTTEGIITHIPERTYRITEWIHTGKYQNRVRKVISFKE